MASNQLAEAPFDPQARYVDKETGVEYEDFGSWVAGAPKDSERNRTLETLVAARVPKQIRNRWWRCYDVAHFVCTEKDELTHYDRTYFARVASGLQEHDDAEKQKAAEIEHAKLRAISQIDAFTHKTERLKYEYLAGSKWTDEDVRKLVGVGDLHDQVVVSPDGRKHVIRGGLAGATTVKL